MNRARSWHERARHGDLPTSAVGGVPLWIQQSADPRIDEFGRFITSEVAAQGRTMTEVAWQADLPTSTVSRIAAGGRDPQLGTAARIARALGYELQLERAA